MKGNEMKLSIVSFIKKYKIIYNTLKYLFIPYWKMKVDNMERNARDYISGKRRTPYFQLDHFKDKYKGKRCFIVATGPSLQISDLDLLYEAQELCFSVNSIVTAFSKTKWRPTFYGIQDYNAYKKYLKEIRMFPGIRFVGSEIKKYFDDKGNIYFPHCLLNHNYPKQERISPILKFSGIASAIIYDGYSITYSMIQLAVFLGFKEIYLLGVDCNYSGPKVYFNENTNKDDNIIHNSTDLMILAFEEAKKYCDRNCIKIVNVTRGGNLEVFPRKTLEDVIF